ncbi:MAG: hypothetical protein KDA61_02180 [Planctomycetales bacterium]|nr:hypothetical protein [Planctomycetales bacterium]
MWKNLILTVAATCLLQATVHGRLFWHTFGATAPGPDGSSSVWNANQDYFVPRHCTSGQYQLYSACATPRGVSPACKREHPLYSGYCTPYGSCRYHWRDHVYARQCGCTPLRAYVGPYRTDACPKTHCCLKTDACQAEGCGGPRDVCAAGCGASTNGYETASGVYARGTFLPNVEPLGGDLLGSVPIATANGMLGMRGGMGGTFPGGNIPSVGGVAIPVRTPPTSGSAGGGSGFSLPFGS